MKVGLIETCKEIVALEDNFILDMGDFEDAGHECGTSYCIAGRLAHLDGYPKGFAGHYSGFNYEGYSLHKIGSRFATSEGNEVWSFLFSAWWPDSLLAAKERAQYVMDTGGVPIGWSYKEATGDLDDGELLEWSKP